MLNANDYGFTDDADMEPVREKPRRRYREKPVYAEMDALHAALNDMGAQMEAVQGYIDRAAEFEECMARVDELAAKVERITYTINDINWQISLTRMKS